MRRLEWTAPAREDLRKIEDWLSRETTPALTVRMLAAIRFRAGFLLNFPHGGPPVFDKDYRSLRVHDTPYLILYRLTHDAVQILRVHHERENWRIDE